MKIPMKTYLGKVIGLVALIVSMSLYTLAVGIGAQVTDPNSCDSGHARFIPYSNDSGGELFCVDADSSFQWAHKFNTMQNSSHKVSAMPMSASAIEVQMDLAESATIWTNADEIYWQYK
ncbi:hypothetical protein LCGC14_3074700, partial [marine sediment metagenome]